MVCTFKAVRVLKDSENGSPLLEIDYKGFVGSFLASVDNDEMWKPVVEESLKKCYDQFNGANEGTACEGY